MFLFGGYMGKKVSKKKLLEKLKELPSEILEGLANSSAEELRGYLRLSHKERSNLNELPFGSRQALNKVLSLAGKKDDLNTLGVDLFDVLQELGGSIMRNKAQSLADKVAQDFQEMRDDKKK